MSRKTNKIRNQMQNLKKSKKRIKQAGAELGQAQPMLLLWLMELMSSGTIASLMLNRSSIVL